MGDMATARCYTFSTVGQTLAGALTLFAAFMLPNANELQTLVPKAN